jgi:hypothetical protein
MTYELACELVLMMIYELFHELMVPMMEQMILNYQSIRNVSTDGAIVEGSTDGLHLDK